jgi:hypothetical protein
MEFIILSLMVITLLTVFAVDAVQKRQTFLKDSKTKK